MLVGARLKLVCRVVSSLLPTRATPTTCCYSTLPRIVESRFPCTNIPHVTLSEFIWGNLNRWPDHIAIVCGVTRRSYTYLELRERCRQFSFSLRRLGLEPKSVVAVAMTNTPDYPLAVLGPSEAGLVVTTINSVLVPAEITKQLLDCNPRVMICLPELYPKLVAAVKLAEASGYKPPIYIIAQSERSCEVPSGAFSLEKLSAPGGCTGTMPPVKVSPCSLAAIMYSSGTSGLPKGVALSHRNLVSNNVQANDTPDVSPTLPTTEIFQDVVVAVIPFSHIYGFQATLMGRLHTGTKIVTLSKFTGQNYLRIIEEFQITTLVVVPTIVSFLEMSKDVTPELLKSCRAIVSAAAPIGDTDAERLMERAHHPIHFMQGYGMTETSGAITLTRIGNKKMSSVGQLVSHTKAKVIDRDTKEMLGSCQEGEICVQGPQMMLGYLNNPKETEAIVDKLGWLHTGDIGYYDEEGDFYIVERSKELLKVKGMQVAPAELENLLRSHPEVVDSAVIGVPCQRRGEVPVAFVSPKDSSRVGCKRLGSAIQEFVKENVSKHKYLDSVTVISKLPMSPSGKVDRLELKEMALKEQKERAGKKEEKTKNKEKKNQEKKKI